nr:unnamed protein product [Digitaria exilis]CAB3448645.1 unnamed protein product [Digitaria exilis]
MEASGRQPGVGSRDQGQEFRGTEQGQRANQPSINGASKPSRGIPYLRKEEALTGSPAAASRLSLSFLSSVVGLPARCGD